MRLDLEGQVEELSNLAKKLALALADEVAFVGDEHAAEASLGVLSEARTRLGLEKEFDEIDSLCSRDAH